jgi:hypothetical protein
MDGGGGGSISSPNQPAACAVIGSRSGAKPLETSVETLGHDRSDNDDSGGHTAQKVAMRSTSSPALELSPRADAIALAVVTALALAVRLHKISEPDAVVFDEMHHGRFALHYLRGQFFFDIHPPLGKLLFALAGHWTGLAQVCMRPCMHACMQGVHSVSNHRKPPSTCLIALSRRWPARGMVVVGGFVSIGGGGSTCKMLHECGGEHPSSW